MRELLFLHSNFNTNKCILFQGQRKKSKSSPNTSSQAWGATRGGAGSSLPELGTPHPLGLGEEETLSPSASSLHSVETEARGREGPSHEVRLGHLLSWAEQCPPEILSIQTPGIWTSLETTLVEVIKGLEKTASWVTQVDPKSSDECP